MLNKKLNTRKLVKKVHDEAYNTRKLDKGKQVRDEAYNWLVGDALSHILSIGFEFECKTMLKLNPDKNNKYFYITPDTGVNIQRHIRSPVVFTSDNSIALENEAELFEIFGILEQDGIKSISDVEMIITNDASKQNDWEHQTLHLCKESKLLLIREDGSKIKIRFDNEDQCPGFPSVEWKILYNNPPTGKNIVLQCFTDACARLQRHLNEYTPEKVQLTNKLEKEFIDVLIYNHTDPTYPKYMKKGIINYKRDEWIKFRPQLTFRVNVQHLYKVVEQLYPSYYKKIGLLNKKLINHY